MNDKFLKPYAPEEVENRIYKLWEESGFFNPDNLPGKDGKPFTIIMPPANANGSLHAGHALMLTIEDIMIRYKRMRGSRALWLPGLDHAGFETQVVFEKKLEKEGRSRFGMDPKALYKEILDFTLENSKNIESQVRSMGASTDWSRELFTLDPRIVSIVYETFKKLSEDKLLYRGARIVSWCPKHRTSFSDLEIKDEERTDSFYYLKYGPFVIATARPETKFGDKYVVMHPEDKRYAKYKHGQKLDLEWINGPITATVIKDEAVDMEFGTGVMTITPWHDQADFDIAERHGLDKEQIIGEDGKLLPIAGEFAGMKIAEARTKIIEKLQSKGLVDKIDTNYKHVVRTCYKCGTVIEPQVKAQWFVSMKPLAERVLEKIESGEIKFIPEHYRKISTHWLENITDWNISRQIVWGIPIPAKICEKCGHGMVDIDDPITSCEKCRGPVHKDTDTFDTWFSSGQWPYATLQALDQKGDGKNFDTFYPTDVLETGGDIIFFWVTRMIMLGLYRTGKAPFSTVYLHGIVHDAKGQKMSKSKGNVINPLDLTAKYGTDALRIALVIGNTPGTSLSLAEDKIKGYKNFANKVWNITRFVLSQERQGELRQELVDELSALTKDVTEDMEEYRFYIAAEKIYHYIWHRFADEILEESKGKEGYGATLYYILETCLKLLHPFMPFVTEEIWQSHEWQKDTEILMVSSWPAN